MPFLHRDIPQLAQPLRRLFHNTTWSSQGHSILRWDYSTHLNKLDTLAVHRSTRTTTCTILNDYFHEYNVQE